MIFTVEPMVNAGRPGIRCLADGWTIVTADHSLSAQWEHTVLVTPDGFEVLTRVRRHAAASGRSDRGMRPWRRCRQSQRQRGRGGGPRIAKWRNALQAERDALRDEFLAHPDTPKLLREHARLVDRVLGRRLGGIGMPPASRSSPSAATVAASCSRIPTSTCCCCCRSTPDAAATRRSSASSRVVGHRARGRHSVRTIAECEAEMAGDATVRTSLLEHRRLAGDARRVPRNSSARSRPRSTSRAFYDAKSLEQQQRHLKHHDAAYNLEPNVKESPGGLRDLQTVLWIARAAGLGRTWRELARAGLMTMTEARAMSRQERFIGAMRVRLHYLTGRREDRLVFDQQTPLARQIGLADTPPRAAQRAADAALLPRGEAGPAGQHDPAAEPARAPVPDRERRRCAIDDDFVAKDELLHVRDETCSIDVRRRCSTPSC